MNNGILPKLLGPNAMGTVRTMRNKQGTDRAEFPCHSAADRLKIPLPKGLVKLNSSY
jgi:hypothetical protein